MGGFDSGLGNRGSGRQRLAGDDRGDAPQELDQAGCACVHHARLAENVELLPCSLDGRFAAPYEVLQ